MRKYNLIVSEAELAWLSNLAFSVDDLPRDLQEKLVSAEERIKKEIETPLTEHLDQKRKTRMEKFDRLPKEYKAFAHDYGLSVLDALTQCGIKKPDRMRHIVKTVLNELSPLGFPGSKRQIA